MRAAAFERDSGDKISECIQSITKAFNLSQAAKGVLSAGAYKTVVYSYAKLKKMVKSLNGKIVFDKEFK